MIIEDKMNIAIIGAGVSGLVSSLILSRKHNVTIFEKNSYPHIQDDFVLQYQNEK